MANRITRGLWFFRVFMMCASLVSVLLAIEFLNRRQISLEPFTGAHAESAMSEGITAKVIREMPNTPAQETTDSKPIDKNGTSH